MKEGDGPPRWCNNSRLVEEGGTKGKVKECCRTRGSDLPPAGPAPPHRGSPSYLPPHRWRLEGEECHVDLERKLSDWVLLVSLRLFLYKNCKYKALQICH